MADIKSKKSKLFYEKNVLTEVKGALVSVEQKTVSDWNAGNGKFIPRKRTKRGSTEGTTIIVQCGGENMSKIKRFDDAPVLRKCISEFQDATYGKGMRVANAAEGKGARKGNYNCSVCGRSHTQKK